MSTTSTSPYCFVCGECGCFRLRNWEHLRDKQPMWMKCFCAMWNTGPNCLMFQSSAGHYDFPHRSSCKLPHYWLVKLTPRLPIRSIIKNRLWQAVVLRYQSKFSGYGGQLCMVVSWKSAHIFTSTCLRLPTWSLVLVSQSLKAPPLYFRWGTWALGHVPYWPWERLKAPQVPKGTENLHSSPCVG